MRIYVWVMRHSDDGYLAVCGSLSQCSQNCALSLCVEEDNAYTLSPAQRRFGGFMS